MSPEATGVDAPRWIAVGRIARAHGVKGEVAVLPLSQVPERFAKGARLLLGESEDRSLTVSASRPHRQRLLVFFDEIRDRTAAERLTGEYLFVPASESPDLPEGEFWAHQLVGSLVVTEAGRQVGTITEIIHTAANDVWVAAGTDGEALIPALKDVVTHVDPAERRIVVREIPGLTAP